jgi:hypothetical protein
MPIITSKSDKINAINDLSEQDNTILCERSEFLFGEVHKELKNLKDELERLKSPEHGIKDAISKMGKKVVGAATKEERIQESLVHLGAIRLSTFIVLNPISVNLPKDIKETAEVSLLSVTYPSNIKHLQENLRSIFGIKEQEK